MNNIDEGVEIPFNPTLFNERCPGCNLHRTQHRILRPCNHNICTDCFAHYPLLRERRLCPRCREYFTDTVICKASESIIAKIKETREELYESDFSEDDEEGFSEDE